MDYTNQYLGLVGQDKLRTTFEISQKDVAVIRALDPKAGTLQTTASILFKKLIHELKKSNIETGDFSAYQHAICAANITLGGANLQRSPLTGISTGSVPACSAETHQENERRGATDVAQQAPRPQELSDAPVASRARRNNSGRKAIKVVKAQG